MKDNDTHPIQMLDDLLRSRSFRQSAQNVITKAWNTALERWSRDIDRPDTTEGDASRAREPLPEDFTRRLVIRDSPNWNICPEYMSRSTDMWIYNYVKQDLFCSHDFKRLIISKVMSKLRQPHIVSINDVMEAIVRGPASEPSCQSDALWNQAVFEIIESCHVECSASTVRVDVATFVPLAPGTRLFHFGNDVWAVIKESGDPSLGGGIVLSVAGACTASASRTICREYLQPFAMLLELYIKRGMINDRNSAMWSYFVSRDERVVTSKPDGLPLVYFVNMCLDVSRLLLGSASSMLVGRDRLITALRLLYEAKRHSELYITSVLAFAAIESLLGKESKGVLEQLARRVAVLLCPNSDDRQRAAAVVRRLYDVRSRVVHGSSLDVMDGDVVSIVHLADVVVLACLEWDIAARRLSGEQHASGDVFFQRLQEADYSGKMLVAVPDDIIAMASVMFIDWERALNR